MPKKRYYMGMWDCGYDLCEHPNQGDSLFCEECNRPRPEGAIFYLPKNAREITDKGEIEAATAGPDWTCMHCQYDNRANNKLYCESCRKLRVEEDEKYFDLGGERKTHKAPTNIFTQERANRRRKLRLSPGLDTRIEPDSGGSLRNSVSAWSSKVSSKLKHIPRRSIILYASMLLGFSAAIFLIWALFFNLTEVPVNVTGHKWERSIHIEKLNTYTESDWDVPSGGRVISQSKEIAGYEKVFSHYEEDVKIEMVQVGTKTKEVECGVQDNANGTFTKIYCDEEVPVYEEKQVPYQREVYKDEPIYKTKWTYYIDRWESERSVSESGDNVSPYWPRVSMRNKERESSRSELYILTLVDFEQQHYSTTVSFEEFKGAKVGDSFIAYVNYFGSIMALK